MSSSVKQKYFEGIIVYNIECISSENNISEEQCSEIFGTKLLTLFQEGNYIKKYYNKEDKLIRQVILNLEDTISFHHKEGSDTITWVNIAKADSKSIILDVSRSEVSEHKSKVLTIETRSKDYEKTGSKIRYVTYFSTKLPINAKWYNNYHESNYNEIMSKGEGVEVRKEIDYGNFKVVESVEEVIWRKIEIEEFNLAIDTNKILIEL